MILSTYFLVQQTSSECLISRNRSRGFASSKFECPLTLRKMQIFQGSASTHRIIGIYYHRLSSSQLPLSKQGSLLYFTAKRVGQPGTNQPGTSFFSDRRHGGN